MELRPWIDAIQKKGDLIDVDMVGIAYSYTEEQTSE